MHMYINVTPIMGGGALQVMALSREWSKYLLSSATMVNTNPSQHTQKTFNLWDVNFGWPAPPHAIFDWYQQGRLWWENE